MHGQPYAVGLTIGFQGKGIPYGGFGHIREDGGANHGFKLLKGQPRRLDEIPELKQDAAMRELVRSLNDAQTGLVSIGCDSGANSDEHGHRRSGYIEFAVNSAEKVTDASVYFPLFFHFSRLLHNQKFQERVQFHWSIEPAHFFHPNADGFTATIYINTISYPEMGAAQASWDRSVAVLEYFLRNVPPVNGHPLFDGDEA